MPAVPERFRRLHVGWLAQCPGQQPLSRALLIVRQGWWRGGVGHWLILPERGHGWSGLNLPSTNALITRRLRRCGYGGHIPPTRPAHLAQTAPRASRPGAE